MGLLDSVLGGVLGGTSGQGSDPAAASGGQGSLMAALLPIALSMLQGGSTGGGGLGNLLGGMLGSAGGGNAPAGLPDGLGGLLRRFEDAGLSRQAASWVGTGQNEAISGDDIGKVLGSDVLDQIAQRAGVSQGEAAGGLAALLPQLVDGLTPEGRVPESDQLLSSLDALTRQFRGG